MYNCSNHIFSCMTLVYKQQQKCNKSKVMDTDTPLIHLTKPLVYNLIGYDFLNKYIAEGTFKDPK